jgi:hypothetical protein
LSGIRPKRTAIQLAEGMNAKGTIDQPERWLGGRASPERVTNPLQQGYREETVMERAGTYEPEDCRARAEVIRAFAAETINPDLRTELTLLAEGYRTLAGETDREPKARRAA